MLPVPSNLMISGIGVNLFVTQFIVDAEGGLTKAMPAGQSLGAVALGPVKIGVLDIVAAVVSTLCLAALWTFLERTKTGVAIRASSYNMFAAELMGVPVDAMAALVFLLAGIMASIAGVFFAYKYSVYPTLGNIANKAFIASVVGGLGSLPGAVIGGLILGTLETLISGYISSIYRDIFSFSALVITLVFMPQGLLGRRIRESL